MLRSIPKSKQECMSFFAILFFSFSGFSQELCSKIIDWEGKPIPYVKVMNQKSQTGVYSDRYGNFCIDYLKLNDSIVIYSGGEYETLNLIVNELQMDEVILAKANENINYEQVSLVSSKSFELNNFSDSKGISLTLSEGGAISSYIHKSENYSGRIQSVSFFLNDYAEDYIVIPAFYEYDIVTATIGNKISLKNFRLDSIKKNDWNEMEILDTIFIPQHGLCVGFECIPRNRKINLYDSNHKPSISFGAYYQSNKDGRRTYFLSSKDHNKWLQLPQNIDDKKNVLNLAVKIKLDGKMSNLPSTPRKFIKQKKVKKLLVKSKPANPEFSQETIKDLYSSVVKLLEYNDVLRLCTLIKIEKENLETLERFLAQNENNVVFKLDQLSTWKNYLKELKTSEVVRIEKDYYSITFKNSETHYLIHENGKWYLTETKVNVLIPR